MKFLLDTNVVSELRKIRAGLADRRVARWAQQLEGNDFYLSVISIEEIEIGALRLERRDPAQGAVLRMWIQNQILPDFAGRILSVDLKVAQLSARLHVPDPRPFRDALIAATALVHGMTLATRYVADLEPMGVPLVNPWES